MSRAVPLSGLSRHAAINVSITTDAARDTDRSPARRASAASALYDSGDRQSLSRGLCFGRGSGGRVWTGNDKTKTN